MPSPRISRPSAVRQADSTTRSAERRRTGRSRRDGESRRAVGPGNRRMRARRPRAQGSRYSGSHGSRNGRSGTAPAAAQRSRGSRRSRGPRGSPARATERIACASARENGSLANRATLPPAGRRFPWGSPVGVTRGAHGIEDSIAQDSDRAAAAAAARHPPQPRQDRGEGRVTISWPRRAAARPRQNRRPPGPAERRRATRASIRTITRRSFPRSRCATAQEP